ncbi:MAG: helix-turn-helix domain-containing protein [Patescibacteria group bacterium]|jgi:sugar-specific transcriptional regulator TrmB
MDIAILKKLGLGDKETAVYLSLLEHGAGSVRNLASLTNLNRGTTYDILKKLQEAGLVSFFHKNTRQHFVAEDPEKILKLLADRADELKNAGEKIKELIPELKSLQEKGGNKPVTKFYEGKAGIKFILDDILNSAKELEVKEYYVYSAAGVREDVYGAYPDFNKKRIKSKIKVNTISLSSGGGTYGLDERKWLKTDRESEDNMTYILIYADKCAFISRDSRNNPVGVIIENEMIYQTQKTIFLQLWKFI